MANQIQNLINRFKLTTFFAILGGIAIIIAAWFAAAQFAEKRSDNYFNNNPDLQISGYSLNGKVKRVSYPIIEFEVGQVVTENGQNNVEYKTYKASVNNQTQYVAVVENPTNPQVGFESITTNSTITVYTSQNPYEAETIQASKIEIR